MLTLTQISITGNDTDREKRNATALICLEGEMFLQEKKQSPRYSHSCKQEEVITLEVQGIFSWFWQLCMTYTVHFLYFQGSQAWKAFSFRLLLGNTAEENLLEIFVDSISQGSWAENLLPLKPRMPIISRFFFPIIHSPS